MFPGAPEAHPSPKRPRTKLRGDRGAQRWGPERAQAQPKHGGAGLGIRSGEGAAGRGPSTSYDLRARLLSPFALLGQWET